MFEVDDADAIGADEPDAVFPGDLYDLRFDVPPFGAIFPKTCRLYHGPTDPFLPTLLEDAGYGGSRRQDYG
jgi:hypothetical protein